MTIKFLRAAMTAAFLLGAASGAAVAADQPHPITADVYKNLALVQAANAKKDFPAALAALDAARQVPDRKPYDDFKIAQFAMVTHLGMKDMAAADIDAEAAADTDPAVIPDAEKIQIYKPALQLAINSKHYDKSAKYAKLILALTPPPSAADQALASQALYLGGDYAGAVALAQKNIDAAKAAGTKPQHSDMDILMSAQAKQKDEAGAERTLETMVADYNEPLDWSKMLSVSFGAKGMRDVDYIYAGRLMPLVGAKVSLVDASLIGNTANHIGFFGDAVAAQNMGGTGFPSPGAKAAADKKSLPSQIAAGAKLGGQYNVKLAQALYGYGQYAQAETAAKLAQTKGGAADSSEPPMVLGMAQAAQGKFAEANATFETVHAPNPAAARVVRFWGYYVKAKLAPPVTAATK